VNFDFRCGVDVDGFEKLVNFAVALPAGASVGK
jgi:hypothetical protein